MHTLSVLWPWLSSATLCAFPLASSTEAPKAAPNVIFILADDLGVGDVGCYGQSKIKTPHIDRLATRGMRFTQAYAGCTVCAPSRCALMTGKHTGHGWIRGNQNVGEEGQVPLPAGTRTVADLMRSAGYATGIFGKWALGYPGSESVPPKAGFDEFFGYNCQMQAHNYYPDHLWRNDEKVPLDGRQYSHDLIAEESLKFVKRHQDHPFFLYLAFTIPHAKLQVPDLAPYESEPWPDPEKRFAAMITRMDRDIGRLVKLLADLNLEDKTLIIFASDNGAMEGGDGHNAKFFTSNGALRGLKRDLYEGGIRTPAIAVWPGKVTPGAVSSHVWAFWDFLAMMADLTGQQAPDDTDGISFLPALLGQPRQRTHELLYWEFHAKGFKQAIRAGDWKAIRFGVKSPRIELYDLSNDPGETIDLAARHPDVAARLADLMKRSRTESTLWVPHDSSKPLPAAGAQAVP